MDVYSKLALEVIDQLGGYRCDVERAIAEGRDNEAILYLLAGSDRYVELTAWGLTADMLKQLDNAIRVELRRQSIIGWK